MDDTQVTELLQHMQVLTLRPNDILVIKSDDLSEDQMARFKQAISAKLSFAVNVILMPTSNDIGVIRVEDPAAP